MRQHLAWVFQLPLSLAVFSDPSLLFEGANFCTLRSPSQHGLYLPYTTPRAHSEPDSAGPLARRRLDVDLGVFVAPFVDMYIASSLFVGNSLMLKPIPPSPPLGRL